MDTNLEYSDLVIVASGPYRFHGAGQIMSQYLIEFSKRGASITFVGPELPFLFKISDSLGVNFHAIPPIMASYYLSSFSNNSVNDGLVSQDLILLLNLSEGILKIVKENIGKRKKIIVWGTYLFPSAFAAHLVKETLVYQNIEADLWITPTGSDIWEIGPQLSSITEWLLNSPLISSLITYTYQFTDEIKTRYKVNQQIETIYPIVNFKRFYPIPKSEKMRKRSDMGFSQNHFIICSHSNMRPVKCPEDVIYVAAKASKLIGRKTTLLMVGPKLDIGDFYCDKKFEIRWEGVVENVEDYLHISDVELNCSRHDSFNLSLAESMASGLPCITTDVVGIGVEIHKSESGFLFPLSPPDEVVKDGSSRYSAPAEFIAKLAASNSLRDEYGRRAYEHAKVVFSANSIMPKFLKIAQ